MALRSHSRILTEPPGPPPGSSKCRRLLRRTGRAGAASRTSPAQLGRPRGPGLLCIGCGFASLATRASLGMPFRCHSFLESGVQRRVAGCPAAPFCRDYSVSRMQCKAPWRSRLKFLVYFHHNSPTALVITYYLFCRALHASQELLPHFTSEKKKRKEESFHYLPHRQ